MLAYMAAIFGLGVCAGLFIGTYMTLQRDREEFEERLRLIRKYGNNVDVPPAPEWERANR